MASTTEIANLALFHIGKSKAISDLDSDRSAEALACKRFYETARDIVLRDFPWPFATKIASLSLVETDPNDEWAYSYEYPSEALTFRRILSGTYPDTDATRVAYRIVDGDARQLVYTNMTDAEAEYTKKITETAKYPPDFVMALSLRLAVYIAPSITAGDPFKLGDRAMSLYRTEITRAAASAINEEQAYPYPESRFITIRNE